MHLTSRETWAVVHGLILGTFYLLAFAGALAGLWSLRPGLITTAGIHERMKRLYIGFGVMATTAWLTVITARGSCTPGTARNLPAPTTPNAPASTCLFDVLAA